MSCVLRISGTTLDIGAAIRDLPVQPYRVWTKGEPKAPQSARSGVHQTSGACFQVGAADMGQFAQQLAEATLFLERHEGWLNELRKDSSVEDVRLDFGVERTDAWVQCLVLSPAFLAAAAKSGVVVELSSYSSSHES